MSPFDDNGKYGDVRWIDTGNSCCLRESLGSKLLEFLAAFKAHGRACVIIQPGGYTDCFVFFCTRGRNLFLPDVSCVMVPDPELFYDGQGVILTEREILYVATDKLVDHVKRLAEIQMRCQRLSFNSQLARGTILKLLNAGTNMACLLANVTWQNSNAVCGVH